MNNWLTVIWRKKFQVLGVLAVLLIIGGTALLYGQGSHGTSKGQTAAVQAPEASGALGETAAENASPEQAGGNAQQPGESSAQPSSGAAVGTEGPFEGKSPDAAAIASPGIGAPAQSTPAAPDAAASVPPATTGGAESPAASPLPASSAAQPPSAGGAAAQDNGSGSADTAAGAGKSSPSPMPSSQPKPSPAASGSAGAGVASTPAAKPTGKPTSKPLAQSESVTLTIVGSPTTGTFMKTTEVEIGDSDTVLDILKKVTRSLKLQMDYSGKGATAYVKGINNLYEFDEGAGSGWMYSVNGKFPNRSAGVWPIKPGDEIRWLYTLDLGKDLGASADDGLWDGKSR